MLFKFWARKSRQRSLILYEKGTHHHLGDILKEISYKYFETQLNLKITWFNHTLSRPKTRLVLGSYHRKHELIKVNRLLDDPEIPPFFIAYIVYHEALHHLYPPLKHRREKRYIHHSQFKAMEKKFEFYPEAKAYCFLMKKNYFSTGFLYPPRMGITAS
jgi:hypothetical protein